MAAEDLDVELFIEEIKKCPAIWNISSEEYRDKNKKMTAWIKICEFFTKNFNNYSDEEKNVIGKKYMSKWKNIRDNFMRNLRKKTGHTGSGRQYIYSRHLSFLYQSIGPSDTQSNHDAEEHIFSEAPKATTSVAVVVPADVEVEESPSPRPLASKEPPNKRWKEDLEKTLVEFMKAPMSCSSPQEFDEDRAFFDSLIPTIKKFNVDQKLELRSGVLNLVRKIRLSNQHPHSQASFADPISPSNTPASFDDSRESAEFFSY